MASAESIVYTATRGLVADRVYPDVAPASVAKPYITYQAVGGVDETTFDGLNEQQNQRMQVNVWATTRAAAGALMQQVLQALTAAPVRGTPIGSPVSEYEDDTKLYGSRLDISIWFTV
ncbi:DUF3168 domain-containing protein [Caballeronia sp. LZ001]|uniref:DUF3168 domain-containing protein n=1 Tax=Caballeronia sp. LZ001 TaxID=3038553 RepID=UPI0028567CD3|nr:DUF3168 domain-containing protein [Caballeronia sp. LZ001]MDR5801201.1 DUF3168 domain-containing protein [Caballeronia sp. LZ001]